jgi:hypothetical protein
VTVHCIVRVFDNVGLFVGRRLRRFVGGITDCVLYVTAQLFSFAFNLLGCTLDLFVRVASPLANLALGTAYGVVNRAFHSIFIHSFTSMVRLARNLLELGKYRLMPARNSGVLRQSD